MSLGLCLRLQPGEAAKLAGMFGVDGSAYVTPERAAELEHECERLAATELPIGTRRYIDAPVLQGYANTIAAIYRHPVYLVGSALEKEDARDVDIVVELPDTEFEGRFCNVDRWAREGETGAWTEAREAWSVECVKVTKAGWKVLSYEIDFKVFPESWARRKFGGLPMRRLSDEGAEDRPEVTMSRAPVNGYDDVDDERYLTDGHGSLWSKCALGESCGLHVVRPGKADCYAVDCPRNSA